MVKEDNGFYIFNCPQCSEPVEVDKKQTNCCIFRHAIYKHDMKQVNPHTPKPKCDQLIKDNKVFGCCKPFKFVFSSTGNYVEKCGYI